MVSPNTNKNTNLNQIYSPDVDKRQSQKTPRSRDTEVELDRKDEATKSKKVKNVSYKTPLREMQQVT